MIRAGFYEGKLKNLQTDSEGLLQRIATALLDYFLISTQVVPPSSTLLLNVQIPGQVPASSQ